MAAGLGFKTFNTGDVLSAADVNGYLMQGILVFASGTARDAAITSPQEGQFAFLKDTNVTTYYTGSAWANVDTTGMTNPMTTTGDVIYSSSGSTPARLGIGTAGQVLQVNSGATAPEWATVSGDVVQIAQQVLASPTAIVTFSSIPATYRNLRLVYQCRGSAAQVNGTLMLRFNADTGSNYDNQFVVGNATTASAGENLAANVMRIAAIPQASATANVPGSGTIVIANYVGTTFQKDLTCTSGYKYGTSSTNIFSRVSYGAWRDTAAITSLTLQEGQFGGDIITGSVFTLYGEK
jgi:hypothetical protein